MFPHGHPISTTTACAVTAIVLAITATLTGSTATAAASSESPATSTITTTTPPSVTLPAPKVALTARDSRPKKDTELTARSREFRAAVSPLATKMNGIKPSLYRGKYYMPNKGEDFRRCVINRESSGRYKAANTSSSARGAYQFLDSQWRESLVHMMRPEARKNGLLPQLRKLNNKPIHKWSRYWQDAAFWTVLNYEAPLSGSHHWGTFGQTYSCH